MLSLLFASVPLQSDKSKVQLKAVIDDYDKLADDKKSLALLKICSNSETSEEVDNSMKTKVNCDFLQLRIYSFQQLSNIVQEVVHTWNRESLEPVCDELIKVLICFISSALTQCSIGTRPQRNRERPFIGKPSQTSVLDSVHSTVRGPRCECFHQYDDQHHSPLHRWAGHDFRKTELFLKYSISQSLACNIMWRRITFTFL